MSGIEVVPGYARTFSIQVLNTSETPNSLLAPPLSAICACVLGVLLVAGLWPFHAPRNEVSWLNQENGLRFGNHGSIASAGTLPVRQPQPDGSCSLELWLEPSRVDSGGTVLAFYWAESRVVPLELRQYETGIELQGRSDDRLAKKTTMFVDKVFSPLKPVYIAVTSTEQGTAVYADGALVRKSANFRFSSADLTGRLIVGDAPSARTNWSGEIKGLAIYDRELEAGEVSRHFAAWTKGELPDWAQGERVVARYLFNERRGNVVHNQIDPANDLLIPERYFVIHEKFLESPWREFHSGRSYWVDIAINIVGFVPFGFFFGAYFSVIRKINRYIWLTITLGFAVSFIIEVLQSFLPTRESGITDLFTNTFGTALGAILLAWVVKHDWVWVGAGCSRFFGWSGEKD